MEANELRIGNWVLNTRYKRGYEMQIESISQFGINIELGYDGLNPIIDDDCSFNECKPIPLTEEWLLKLGFEKKEGCMNNIYFILAGKILLEYNLTYNIVDFVKKVHFDVDIPIKHVHQLQNLYWCLCGEELISK